MAESGKFGGNSPKGLPLACLGIAPAQLFYKRHQFGVHLDMGLAALALPIPSPLAIPSGLELATRLAFSNCAMAPSTWGPKRQSACPQ
jgi:hypothetical protein